MRLDDARPRHVVFRIHNRRGLGHLMRSTVLARQIMLRAPGTAITFVVRALPDKDYQLRGVRYLAAPNPDRLGLLPADSALASADLLIDDTVLPPIAEDLAAAWGLRRALVMRRSTPERHAELLAHPALSVMNTIVVPHERGDFGHTFPREIEQRVVFAGAVARLPDPEIGSQCLARYGISDDDWLLISTPGGGGFESDLERFLEIISAVHTRLLSHRPGLKHLLVLGPHAGRRPPDLPRLMVIEEEPNLVSLFPYARAVISAAGYNTINELRVAQVPALLLPGRRRYDDQLERCARLQLLGIAEVYDAQAAEVAIDQIAATIGSGARLAAMSAAQRRHPLALGNASAAAALMAAFDP